MIKLLRPSAIYSQYVPNCINIGGINILKEFKGAIYESATSYDFMPNTQYLGELINMGEPFILETALLDFSVKESLDEIG